MGRLRSLSPENSMSIANATCSSVAPSSMSPPNVDALRRTTVPAARVLDLRAPPAPAPQHRVHAVLALEGEAAAVAAQGELAPGDDGRHAVAQRVVASVSRLG